MGSMCLFFVANTINLAGYLNLIECGIEVSTMSHISINYLL